MEEIKNLEEIKEEVEENKEEKNELNIDIEAKNILNKIASQPLNNLNEDINNEELIKLFNNNQLKKTMQRILKSNDLLDKITEQALNRLTENPDNFSNTELLNYMKIVQDSIINSQKTLTNQQEKINTPLIQINQINNEIDSLSQESQNKILFAVEELLKIINTEDNNIVEGEIKIIEENKGE